MPEIRKGNDSLVWKLLLRSTNGTSKQDMCDTRQYLHVLLIIKPFGSILVRNGRSIEMDYICNVATVDSEDEYSYLCTSISATSPAEALTFLMQTISRSSLQKQTIVYTQIREIGECLNT